MATISNETFLFSCIKFSNGGVVNWQLVADECGIVSKAAAAIKYKRMQQKYGTVSENNLTDSPMKAAKDTEGGKGKKKSSPKKANTAKKRKIDAEEDQDDEEIASEVKEEDGEDEE